MNARHVWISGSGKGLRGAVTGGLVAAGIAGFLGTVATPVHAQDSFANVTLTKSATSTSPDIGASDTFTLTLANSASSTANSGQDVVTDGLANGLPYESSTSSNCGTGSCVAVSGQTVTWTVPDLAPDASATLQIVVNVDTSSSVSNTATFSQTVPNSSGETTGSSNTVTLHPAWANLTLAKSATSTSPDVGASDTFTLTLANSASSTANSGQDVVTDVLANGLPYESSTSSNCGTGSCVAVSGQTVTWTVPDLAPDASATLQIVVNVDTSSSVSNTATFSQTVPNSSGGTTGSSNTVTLYPAWADVSVTKSVTSTDPVVGTDDTFTLTAGNAADSTSGSGAVAVTDVLANGLTYESSTAANCGDGSCVSVVGQTVTWTLSNLGAGSSSTLQIVVSVDALSPVSNTATFSQTIPNSSGETTGVSNSVSLTPVEPDVTQTSVSCSPDPVAVGQPTTCTAAVTDTESNASPTGSVTISSGGAGSFSGSPCTLSGTGSSASCQVGYTPTAGGSQTITASYGADPTHAASSGTTTLTVVTSTSLNLSSDGNPSTVGQVVKLTATVSPTPDGGTVSFSSNGSGIASCQNVAVTAGAASCSTPFNNNGVYSIVATYSGDTYFSGSTSNTVEQDVQTSTGTTLTSSANPSAIGKVVEFTATVSPAPDGGTVAYTSSGALVPDCQHVAVVNGAAQCAISFSAAGSYAVRATYAGDQKYASSTATSIQQRVVKETAPTIKDLHVDVKGKTVTMHGMATATTPGASIRSITWRWGDKSANIQRFPGKHTYKKSGTYKITITAADSNGLTKSTTKTVKVH
jgi:hypothetical protein